MAINWYPGHMHKANREMAKAISDVDIVIELLDCRLPYSSGNPSIARFTGDRPTIKILSKSDLADPDLTSRWQEHFERAAGTRTLATTLDQADKSSRLLALIEKMVPGRSRSGASILAMVTGIPNVGKSTLINTLSGRKAARTGNEPAITRGLQRYKLERGVTLLDTPGLLWPKISNENSGYRLAASGAIRDTAMDMEDVALYLADYLLQQYPRLLQARYELEAPPASAVELLNALGAKRGCLRGGGRVDLEKASTVLVKEFRSGALGRITLETPELMTREKADLEGLQAQQKASRRAGSRGARSASPEPPG